MLKMQPEEIPLIPTKDIQMILRKIDHQTWKIGMTQDYLMRLSKVFAGSAKTGKSEAAINSLVKEICASYYFSVYSNSADSAYCQNTHKFLGINQENMDEKLEELIGTLICATPSYQCKLDMVKETWLEAKTQILKLRSLLIAMKGALESEEEKIKVVHERVYVNGVFKEWRRIDRWGALTEQESADLQLEQAAENLGKVFKNMLHLPPDTQRSTPRSTPNAPPPPNKSH